MCWDGVLAKYAGGLTICGAVRLTLPFSKFTLTLKSKMCYFWLKGYA